MACVMHRRRLFRGTLRSQSVAPHLTEFNMKGTARLAALVAVVVGVFPSVVSSQAIRPGFGTTSDGRNDDGTYTAPGGCTNSEGGGTCPGTAVNVGFTGNFSGTTFSSVFLNTNGNATINGPQSTFTPFSLVDGGINPIFAPFFADVDTRNPASAVMTFGSGSVDGHTALGIDWLGVGYFEENADKLDVFQLMLIDRGDTGAGNFDFEFNYGNMLWETGDASGGSGGFGGECAAVGYSNGSSGASNRSFELPGSHTCGALIDGGADALNTHDLNSDVLGRYVFSVRGGEVVTTTTTTPPPPTSTTTTPEPGTYGLVLTGLALLAIAARNRKANWGNDFGVT
jgi:hypothetical protein